MNTSIRNLLNKALTVMLSATWVLASGIPAYADDTEIFFGQAGSAPGNNPNIMLIIDSSGSMDDPVDGDTRDRLKVVQDVAVNLVNNLTNVNIGIMKFDYDRSETDYDGVSNGGMVIAPVRDVVAHKSTLVTEINKIHHYGATPLQETYLEAAYYFMGKNAFYGLNSHEGYINTSGYSRTQPRNSHADSMNSGTYISPMTGACQRNYIVYLSDGKPTRDTHAQSFIETLLGDAAYDQHTKTTCANDHGNTSGQCIDELAEFLYENDFSTAPGHQNVVSHFIGFDLELPIFQDAAALGGGTYKRVNNAAELQAQLMAIVNQVVDTDDGFTAPAVTVNAFDRTSHLDQLYFTVFKPSDTDRWDGNLKKYEFVPKANEDGLIIVGQNGQPAVDPASGFFYDGRDATGALDPSVPVAHSFWSASPDGAKVTAGGAANELGLGRHIITNPGDGASGSLIANNIDGVPALATFLASVNGTGDELTATQWLDWAAGIDVKDANGDGSTVDARQQLGAPLHSKPAVVVYGGDASSSDVTLYVGTNDGYLHAFNGATGAERWAFMPKDLWKNIPALAEDNQFSGNLPYGVDGHITVHKNDGGDGVISGGGDFVHLYFGLRRGGNHYYALDVTNPDNPKMMWKFTTSGQSWSRPVVAKVNMGTDASPVPKTVVLLGGGYNENQDGYTGYNDDLEGGTGVGNAIYMVDATTGAELWKASNAGADLNVPEMVSAIPSAIRPLDMNRDGFVDRMYVNDIAGRLFRFDIHHDGTSNRVTAGVIASVGGAETSSKAQNRRFYYAPDISLGSESGAQFLTVTMASGFRAHPLETQINDKLFGVRDYNPFNKLGIDPATAADDYDYDVTVANMFDLDSRTTPMIPAGTDGWYKDLTGSGEKSLARSRIFQNKAYFTTYQPGSAPSSNPCAAAVGSGKLIVIDLLTGDVTENLLNKPGIPPETTFLFGEAEVNEGGSYDNCFGSGCSTPDPNDPNGTDPDPDSGTGTRPIECLAGPESCEADASEAPRRTFWRQVSDD